MAQQRNLAVIQRLVEDAPSLFSNAASLVSPPMNLATGKMMHDLNVYRLLLQLKEYCSGCPFLVTAKGLPSLSKTQVIDCLCSIEPILAPVILKFCDEYPIKLDRVDKPKPKVLVYDDAVFLHVLQPRSMGDGGDNELQQNSMQYRWIKYFPVGICRSTLGGCSFKLHQYLKQNLRRFACPASIKETLWEFMDYAVFVMDRFYDPLPRDMEGPNLPSCCKKITYYDPDEDSMDVDQSVFNEKVECSNELDETSSYTNLITLLANILKKQMQILGLKWREPKARKRSKLPATERQRESIQKKMLLYWTIVRVMTIICYVTGEPFTAEITQTIEIVCNVEESLANLREKVNQDEDSALSVLRTCSPIARQVDKLANWFLLGVNHEYTRRQATALLCIKRFSPGTEDIPAIRFCIRKVFPSTYLY
uniref:Uncharacterized protein n=1 Tax=Clandestinovirus TaxID=2831644 RepID=A0A8F8KPG3_9VIRU|nr:hypothetical protein KOM_12_598 [Clandestinovirus]